MSYAFAALAGEYTTLLSRMVINGGKLAEFEATAHRVIALAKAHGTEWSAVHAATGVNIGWGMCSFERESDSDYRTNPAQGDPWYRVSTHVPRGRGPFKSWGAACIDAYRIDNLESVGEANWTWARCCYEGELFNGFGYRGHGVHSPYLWAGTNIYTRGKYVSDGVWSSSAVDQQLGMIPLLYTVARMAPEDAPVDATPSPYNAPIPGPALCPAGISCAPHDVTWVQQKLGIPADGIFGRQTRNALVTFQKEHALQADGLFGPETEKAMEALA